MDAVLSSAQKLLVDASTRFMAREWPIGRVRDTAKHGLRASHVEQRAMGELGWFSLLVPPELGGGGLSDNSLVDCVLVGRARGATLNPVNFVGMNVVAAALAMAGSGEQTATVLPGLLSGELSATWASGSTGPDVSPTAGVFAQRLADGTGYVLRGAKAAVADAAGSDWLLVSAVTDDGDATQFLLPTDSPGVRTVELKSLDLTRRFAGIVFDEVTVAQSALVGEWGGAAALVDYQFQLATVLTTAETVGAMRADFALALEYAKTRIAFGRPIGSFQAVKHLLADTSLMVESSDAVLFAAARSLGRGDDDADRIVSLAKAYVSENGVEVVHNCFQVFGGVGFTWEHDQHLYFRRVTADAMLHGDAQWHRERLCRLAGL